MIATIIVTHTRHVIAAISAALVFASCSDDPVGPGGGGTNATTYQASMDFFGSPIRSLWGTPSGDVYASGNSIMRYDGTAWEVIALPNADDGLLTTWGADNGDLYAVGESDMHRYDGSQWHRIARPAQVEDIWGAPNGEIFVVGGGNNRLYHYDGAGWFVDSLKVDNGDPWRLVSGGNPDDVYIAGYNGWVGHYDGVDWSASRTDSRRAFQSIWKAPDGPLYMATYDSLFTYDGVQLTPVDLGTPVWSPRIYGRSAVEVYCSGESDVSYASIYRYDGIEWSSAADVYQHVNVVWGDRSSHRLLAGGYNVVWEIEGSDAKPLLGDPGLSGYDFMDLWGSEEDGVFLIGSRAYRYHEGAWIDLRKQDLTSQRAYSIWGRSGDELYAVGSSLILHYDGASWTAVSGGAGLDLTTVWGNESEVFAVGYNGAIVRHDGSSWQRMESGTSYALFAVYAWEGGAFAGGESGALMRYDGREWKPFPSPVGWHILDMFGFGPNNIFAAGSNSTEICRFDGRTWTPVFIGYTRGANFSIWGTSDRDLFLGQGRGDVLHFDGRNWSYLPRATTSIVRSVWGAPGHELIAASEGGVIRYHR